MPSHHFRPSGVLPLRRTSSQLHGWAARKVPHPGSLRAVCSCRGRASCLSTHQFEVSARCRIRTMALTVSAFERSSRSYRGLARWRLCPSGSLGAVPLRRWVTCFSLFGSDRRGYRGRAGSGCTFGCRRRSIWHPCGTWGWSR